MVAPFLEGDQLVKLVITDQVQRDVLPRGAMTSLPKKFKKAFREDSLLLSAY